jgi:transposase-like protein
MPRQRRAATKAAVAVKAERGRSAAVPAGQYTIRDAARSIGVDPKTLHRWLGRVDITPGKSPLDRRFKLVSQEDLQQLKGNLTPSRDRGEQHPMFGDRVAEPEWTPPPALWPSHVDQVLAELRRRLSALEQYVYAHGTQAPAVPAQDGDLSTQPKTDQVPDVRGSLDELDTIIQDLSSLKAKLKQSSDHTVF